MNDVVDRVALALWKTKYPGYRPLFEPDDSYRMKAREAILGTPSGDDDRFFVWTMIWELFDVCDDDKAFLQTVLNVKTERDRLIRKAAEQEANEPVPY